ncbi:aminotransferase class V-fold PLP-dependent enzyme [Lentisphaerota bacterium WC36G]|nr:aminotransferase class V-fold PLP-dependent enzyme [Lentisphaerae bacterium WC36]
MKFVPTVPHLFESSILAMQEPIISHRSDNFNSLFNDVKNNLIRLSFNYFYPIIVTGTGTYANELMIWNFAHLANKILILTNGEFGQRLKNQCLKCRADSLIMDFGWGKPFDFEQIAKTLEGNNNIDWIYAVAMETSCGMKNSVDKLNSLAQKFKVKIALDAVSDIGVNNELFRYDSVKILSASSGKALAALPGISLLFVANDLEIKEFDSCQSPYQL